MNCLTRISQIMICVALLGLASRVGLIELALVFLIIMSFWMGQIGKAMTRYGEKMQRDASRATHQEYLAQREAYEARKSQNTRY